MTKKEEKATYDHFKQFGDDVEGYEGLDMSVMAIPFIRIIQALSPQLNKRKAEYVPAAEIGDVVNNITGQIYTTPLKIVIGKFEHIYTAWKPKRGGFQGVFAPEMVETDPKYVMNEKFKLIDSETGNELVDTYVYYCMLPDYMQDEVVILSLSSTQLKEAKKLNRLLMTTYLPGTQTKAKPFFMVWELSITEESNDQGDWAGLSFKFDKFVTPELLEHVVTERKALPNKRVDYSLIEETAGKPDKDAGADHTKY